MHRALERSKFIFGSRQKELNFFNKRPDQMDWDGYLQHFAEASNEHVYLMESTPHYFQESLSSVNTARNIKDGLSSVKIVVSFRNPIDRYESAYIHHMMEGRIPYSNKIDEVVNDNKMLELGNYIKHKRHWDDLFDDIHYIVYDDIIKDGFSVVKGIFSYIELDCDLTDADINFRTNDKAIKRQKMQADWKEMPALTSGARSKLIEYYKESIDLLSADMNRDLSHWYR